MRNRFYLLDIMRAVALREFILVSVLAVICSNGFSAYASDYIGTVTLRMTGHMAKDNIYGPWVYSEPIDKSATNGYANYTIYDDKILDENGSVYKCINASAPVNGITTAVYQCDDTTYILRIGTELIVIMEEGNNDYYMELGGPSGPQALLNHQYLSNAQSSGQSSYNTAQQSQNSGWQQLADALNQLGAGINQSLGNYAANTANQNYSSSNPNYASAQSSSQNASDVWIPTNVLEIHSGTSIRTTHQFHNWYKRFYGNRWCLFPHKGGSQFHVATPNRDRTCEGYDVSKYAYKAIAPTGLSSTGTRYYYFN